jgi:hypothetical protein
VGTAADNARDRSAKGRNGTRHLRKLTDAQAKAIHEDSRVYRVIAEEYNVSLSTISSIKGRKTYKDIIPDFVIDVEQMLQELN